MVKKLEIQCSLPFCVFTLSYPSSIFYFYLKTKKVNLKTSKTGKVIRFQQKCSNILGTPYKISCVGLKKNSCQDENFQYTSTVYLKVKHRWNIFFSSSHKLQMCLRWELVIGSQRADNLWWCRRRLLLAEKCKINKILTLHSDFWCTPEWGVCILIQRLKAKR